jgi:formiminoglutamase
VIDANRPPDGASLYPGQNTTGLVPLEDFDGNPIWIRKPDENEIARRLGQFHRPYHTALAQEIERVRSVHGFALLYDCHSIRSTAPYLFEGRLPDLNIGTN